MKTRTIPPWQLKPKTEVYVCAVCGGELRLVNPDDNPACWYRPEVECTVNPKHEGIITRGRWRRYKAMIEADQVLCNYPELRSDEPTISPEKLKEYNRILWPRD